MRAPAAGTRCLCSPRPGSGHDHHDIHHHRGGGRAGEGPRRLPPRRLPRDGFSTALCELSASLFGHDGGSDQDRFYERWFQTPAARAAYVARVLDPPGTKTPATDALAGVEAALREELDRLELFVRFSGQARAEVEHKQAEALAVLARLLATPPLTTPDPSRSVPRRRFEDVELETPFLLGARHAGVCEARCSTVVVERALASLCPV